MTDSSSYSSQQDISQLIVRLAKEKIVDVTDLIDWSHGNDDQEIREDAFGSISARKLKAGHLVTIRSLRSHAVLASRPEERSRALEAVTSSLTAWSKCQHENIIPLFGIARYQDRIAIVVFNESLLIHEYMAKHPSADRCQLAVQTSSGLVYLHNHNVNGVNINGSNVMVFSDGVAKLGCFDKMKILKEDDVGLNSLADIWWKAPESINSQYVDDFDSDPDSGYERGVKSDVYALGMTILEIFTGKRPYAELESPIWALKHTVILRQLPRRPAHLVPNNQGLDDKVWTLLLNCWKDNPGDRPNAEDIKLRLSSIQQKCKSSQIEWGHHSTLSLAPNISEVTIESRMSASDVITHLTAHSCPDVTATLKLSHCDIYPTCGGGFSDVYQGRLLDNTAVAIKCLRLSIGTTDRKSKVHKHAARELYPWSKLKHPNILELLGLASFRNQIAMVSPWMSKGSLSSYTLQNPDVNRCELCAQVTDGLAYMHNQRLIHGDIKAANVLISDEGTAKLTDFGCTILREDATLQFTRTETTNLSLRWAAPEILNEESLATVASDVYALAMTILEVISGRLPYDGKSGMALYGLIVWKKRLPDRPQREISTKRDGGNALWQLLQRCWSFDPGARPAVSDIRVMMKLISHKALGDDDDDVSEGDRNT